MGTNDDFRIFLWRFTGVKQYGVFLGEIGILTEFQWDFYGISTDSKLELTVKNPVSC